MVTCRHSAVMRGVTRPEDAMEEERNKAEVLSLGDGFTWMGSSYPGFPGRGRLRERMTAALMRLLAENGIRTAFLRELPGGGLAFRETEPAAFTAAVRYFGAGSFSERTGTAEGKKLLCPALSLALLQKDGEGAPVSGYELISLGLADEGEVREACRTAFAAAEVLSAYFREKGTDLIDVTLHFGKDGDGLCLTGELSPDSMRLWDAAAHERLDADRYRKGLGHEEDAYRMIAGRMGIPGGQ